MIIYGPLPENIWGSGGTAPNILTLNPTWCHQPPCSPTLSPRKDLPVLVDLSQCVQWRQQSLWVPIAIKPLFVIRSAHSLVTVPTELFWLRYMTWKDKRLEKAFRRKQLRLDLSTIPALAWREDADGAGFSETKRKTVEHEADRDWVASNDHLA